ncbi:Protein phosphatase 2C 1 [Entophlyctis sp. JEL0112]|nr:Protein phosphatase 2C 1 [Entophlyctis sp. JEL0112]
MNVAPQKQEFASPAVSETMLADDAISPRSRRESAEPEHKSAPHASPVRDRATGFNVGVCEDRNRKHRRTMEVSAEDVILTVGDRPSCRTHTLLFSDLAMWTTKTLLDLLKTKPTAPIPELLNDAFVLTDKQLASRQNVSSGCTAVVAFVREEERPASADSKTLVKKRVLYTANVGDARAVLRLTYDHKGSDSHEVQRIREAGGFVVNGRVNGFAGVLAVTRALGDISMKDYIIGNPYTTETVIADDDTALILACDGKLWDVCSDQAAVDFLNDGSRVSISPQAASEELLNHALDNFSTDNLSVMVIKFQ